MRVLHRCRRFSTVWRSHADSVLVARCSIHLRERPTVAISAGYKSDFTRGCKGWACRGRSAGWPFLLCDKFHCNQAWGDSAVGMGVATGSRYAGSPWACGLTVACETPGVHSAKGHLPRACISQAGWRSHGPVCMENAGIGGSSSVQLPMTYWDLTP